MLLATGMLLGALATAAQAAPPPASVSSLAASLGPHGLVLSWSPSGSGTPVVRDVTGLGSGYGPTDGRGIAATASSAYDTAFTNTADATYAVWAADSDGTLSANPVELPVSPLPALPTATVLDALPSVLVANHTLTVVGHVTRAGVPFPGAKVDLRSRVGGTSSTTTIRTITSGLDGSVRAAFVPTRTRTYQLVLAADQFSSGSASATRAVNLQPVVSAAFAPTTIPYKKSSVLRGTVVPNLAGRWVAVQRYYSGGWHSVTKRTLNSSSAWSWSVAPTAGRYTYRAILPSNAAYRTAASPGRVLTVLPRTLALGMSGADVLGLEKRLAAQHYVVGTVNGYFDSNLKHAVIAFQKVERLSRTGTWGGTERTRVLHPRGFALRYHDSRLTAEIDITRQVLVLARSGVIQNIVDISSGSEHYYYQDGVRYVAHTPRGVYSVYRKIDGVRVSKLGSLYRPSYFHQGWAIHGSSSVPTYPASHGCVRLTNYVTDRLYSKLVIGTRVAVYDS
ncbi:MAG TPA: L,D-transpeptidase family protein [Mycobacteriales bacterium]|nr:L,D-transpeptidase family protein [Mycobacteriales bacterium]